VLRLPGEPKAAVSNREHRGRHSHCPGD
jgi:hypothetical protein